MFKFKLYRSLQLILQMPCNKWNTHMNIEEDLLQVAHHTHERVSTPETRRRPHTELTKYICICIRRDAWKWNSCADGGRHLSCVVSHFMFFHIFFTRVSPEVVVFIYITFNNIFLFSSYPHKIDSCFVVGNLIVPIIH